MASRLLMSDTKRRFPSCKSASASRAKIIDDSLPPAAGTSRPSRATFSQGSPRFLGATLTYPWNAKVTERPRVSLTIMSQRKSDPDEDKDAADAAIEPLFELIAGPESAADSS